MTAAASLASVAGNLGKLLAELKTGGPGGPAQSAEIAKVGGKLENVQNMQGGLSMASNLGGAIEKSATSKSPLAAGSNLLDTGGDLLMATGGPVGMAVGAAVKLGAALIGLPDKIHEWGAAMEQSNFSLAQFSAGMSQVQAQREIEQFHIKREQGDNRAGSAAKLSAAMSGLERTMAPLQDKWANFQNEWTANLVKGMDVILKKIGVGDKDDAEKDAAGVERAIGMNEWMSDIGVRENQIQKKRPKRLGGMA